jgi:hypothetical protein
LACVFRISFLGGLVLPIAVCGQGSLSLLGQFNPGLGQLVSAGFDPSSDRVWIYSGFGSTLNSYSRTGTFQSSLNRPGEGANDVDIDFTALGFTLGSTSVPVGSLLFINGESGTADIYAMNPASGSVIASLATAFGASHVVGGAYHHDRGTFFLVADRNDVNPSTIAEIDPVTGSVLNSFGTGGGGYTINFGDLDISQATGNLFLVSSDESSIRELTPSGVFVRDLPLPGGVGSLSGIAIDDTRGEAFLTGTGGLVWQVGGFAVIPEPGTVSLLVVGALAVLVRRRTWKA